MDTIVRRGAARRAGMSHSTALLTLCLAVLVAQLDTAVVNLGTHRIEAYFHASVGALQWVVDTYIGGRQFASIQSTRATLMLAWQVIRTARDNACIILDMADHVAEIIGDLQLTELDRIADRRQRHLEPRWADRPAVWRAVLEAALVSESAAIKRADAYGLQLLTGDLVPISKNSRSPDVLPVANWREPAMTVCEFQIALSGRRAARETAPTPRS